LVGRRGDDDDHAAVPFADAGRSGGEAAEPGATGVAVRAVDQEEDGGDAAGRAQRRGRSRRAPSFRSRSRAFSIVIR
jgi:hypothetical protein